MRKLLFLIALLFTVVCFADPPTETKVFKPDKTFVAQASYVVSCPQQTAIVEQDAFLCTSEAEQYTIENIYVTGDNPMVREVTTCRKYSLPKAESGTATENAGIAINPTCTENSAFKSPPLLCSANVATNNKGFVRNLQHTNYGYPLTARTRTFFS
ncbi:hypothetical protein OU798_07280 [Prolixibacteraceae bacterium Z1-6]|uniref:Uncharacterized protein n=1 Tax=Draconibacterium aestuarii TaxID=2998507 RepID=A0A9X3F472_9BACT|nr:hypothetical protein [Prolixibacteraceae bacterium Z1-6]